MDISHGDKPTTNWSFLSQRIAIHFPLGLTFVLRLVFKLWATIVYSGVLLHTRPALIKLLCDRILPANNAWTALTIEWVHGFTSTWFYSNKMAQSSSARWKRAKPSAAIHRSLLKVNL